MLTSLENWYESKSFFRGPAGQANVQRRDFRRFETGMQEEEKLREKIAEEFAKTPASQKDIQKAIEKYAEFMDKKRLVLQDIAIRHKKIFNDELDKASLLGQAISSNPREPGKEQILNDMHAIKVAIEDDLNTLIRDFNTYHSLSLSTLKILGVESLAQTEAYKANEAKKDLRVATKVFKKDEKIEHKDKQLDEAQLKAAVRKFQEAVTYEKEILSSTLLLLQKLTNVVFGKVYEMIDEQVNGPLEYPKEWAEENKAPLKKIEKEIEDWLKLELAEGRIFLSKEQHKLVA